MDNVHTNVETLIEFCCMNFVEDEKDSLSEKLSDLKTNIGEILSDYFLPLCSKGDSMIITVTKKVS